MNVATWTGDLGVTGICGCGLGTGVVDFDGETFGVVSSCDGSRMLKTVVLDPGEVAIGGRDDGGERGSAVDEGGRDGGGGNDLFSGDGGLFDGVVGVLAVVETAGNLGLGVRATGVWDGGEIDEAGLKADGERAGGGGLTGLSGLVDKATPSSSAFSSCLSFSSSTFSFSTFSSTLFSSTFFGLSGSLTAFTGDRFTSLSVAGRVALLRMALIEVKGLGPGFCTAGGLVVGVFGAGGRLCLLENVEVGTEGGEET